MAEQSFEYMHVEGGAPVKMWTKGVPVDDKARDQLSRAAQMPFIFKHVAVDARRPCRHRRDRRLGDPDQGRGDPGRGRGRHRLRHDGGAHLAARARTCPTIWKASATAIEQAVPHGRDVGRGKRDKGSWGDPPAEIVAAWATLAARFKRIADKYPKLEKTNNLVHLGTLGTGNHFIELCLDEADRVWVMLHSGSRGVGNAIGSFFIELAKQDMRKWFINLPDENLAYFTGRDRSFRRLCRGGRLGAGFRRAEPADDDDQRDPRRSGRSIAKPFDAELEAINCHHNYVQQENHFGENVLVTRKGAVRAAEGRDGHHPGLDGREVVHRARAAATRSRSTAAATARAG